MHFVHAWFQFKKPWSILGNIRNSCILELLSQIFFLSTVEPLGLRQWRQRGPQLSKTCYRISKSDNLTIFSLDLCRQSKKVCRQSQRPLMLMIGNLPSRWGAFTSRLLLYQIPNEVCGAE